MEADKYKKEYGQECQRVAGTGKKLGAVKNWLMLGLFKAYMKDEANDRESKKKMEALVGQHYRDNGVLTTRMATRAAHLVGHVDITAAARVSYLTIMTKGPSGPEILTMFETAFAREGELQQDGPAPRPVMRNLRKVEREGRDAYKGKGGGKGKGKPGGRV